MLSFCLSLSVKIFTNMNLKFKFIFTGLQLMIFIKSYCARIFLNLYRKKGSLRVWLINFKEFWENLQVNSLQKISRVILHSETDSDGLLWVCLQQASTAFTGCSHILVFRLPQHCGITDMFCIGSFSVAQFSCPNTAVYPWFVWPIMIQIWVPHRV